MDEQAVLRSELQSNSRSTNQFFQRIERALIRPTETIHADSVIGFQAYLPKPRLHPCASNCKCDCHKGHSFKSSSFFDRILGILLLRYAGKPLGTIQKCSSGSCQARSHVEARVQYVFPLWFLNRMIDLYFRVSYLQEPCVSLTVRGLFSNNSHSLILIVRDDEEGLQLSSGGARPNDVSIADGSNVLCVSITMIIDSHYISSINIFIPLPTEKEFTDRRLQLYFYYSSGLIDKSIPRTRLPHVVSRVCRDSLAAGADPRYEPTQEVYVQLY